MATNKPDKNTTTVMGDESFTRGLRAFHDVNAEARVQRTNAQRISFVLAIITTLALFLAISISRQPRAIPYVVEVDKTSGEAYAMAAPPRIDQIPPNVMTPIIQKTLQKFVEAVRTVTPEAEFQAKLMKTEVYPFLGDGSEPTTLVSTFYKANNPYTLAPKEIVEVSVDLPQQETLYTYSLHWIEKTETLNGNITGTQEWEGYAAVKLADVSIEQRADNPFGIILTNLNWQPKINPGVTAATTAP